MAHARPPTGNRIEKLCYGEPRHEHPRTDGRVRYGEPQHETKLRNPQRAERIGYEDRRWTDVDDTDDRSDEGTTTTKPTQQTGALAYTKT